LHKAAKIVQGNALRINWEEVVEKNELNYILGNPPFNGKQLQTQEQKKDMQLVFIGVKGAGVMDYVSAWYIRASQYIQKTTIKVAFVSTNSITQGEQVSILWNELFKNYGIKIHFAHRTFDWKNEAKGNAAVFVVIIGFAAYDTKRKTIFHYHSVDGESQEINAKNISPYLIDYKDTIISSRTNPICGVPSMKYGSKPVEDGNLLLTEEEKNMILNIEPQLAKYIKPLISAKE